MFFHFCASLQNAAANKLRQIKVRKNKRILKLCHVLYDLGFIAGFSAIDSKFLLISLKYKSNRSVLRTLAGFSRPSSRVYYSRRNLRNGLYITSYRRTSAFTVLSTNYTSDFLTDIECYMLGIGGEPICCIT